MSVPVASTSTMFARGAITCAHSMSSAASCSHVLPPVDEYGPAGSVPGRLVKLPDWLILLNVGPPALLIPLRLLLLDSVGSPK